MSQHVSFVDSEASTKLLAVAETLDDALATVEHVGRTLPEAADRLVTTRAPMVSGEPRIVQPPRSLDTTGNLPVLYLGGTISPENNWQAVAAGALSGLPAVIVHPRPRRPARNSGNVLWQTAWQHRHLWRCDLGLFWFAAAGDDSMVLIELGVHLASSMPIAIGASVDLARSPAIRAYAGHMTGRTVHRTLEETVAAAAALAREQTPNRLRLPYETRQTTPAR